MVATSTRSANPLSASDATRLLDAGDGAAVVVPGGDFLLTADFVRAGPDLILRGDDGREVVVAGYFMRGEPPALMTETGQRVPGDLAEKLAGPEAPGQVAQAQGTAAGKVIGVVQKLTGTVTVRHPDGSETTLKLGDKVLQGDVLETAAGSSVGVVFEDRSTFSLGARGRMVLDEMIYDPAAPAGSKSSFSVMQGAFSFISGDIAKQAPDAMTVRTPVLTIGVRGTRVAGFAAAEGSENTVTLLAEDGGQVFGEITITNAGGTLVLNQPFQSIQLSSFTMPPPPPSFLPPAAVEQIYGDALNASPPPPPPGSNPVQQDNGTQPQTPAGQEGAAPEEA
ncbi:MAG: FecR domain-containing protein, partial [Pseudomonadota bacterium]